MIRPRESFDSFRARVETWRPWFAWYPVMWGSGWAWLSTIERRAKPPYAEWQAGIAYECRAHEIEWEYRVPGSTIDPMPGPTPGSNFDCGCGVRTVVGGHHYHTCPLVCYGDPAKPKP